MPAYQKTVLTQFVWLLPTRNISRLSVKRVTSNKEEHAHDFHVIS